jgi:salicylate hydroxylase
VVTRAGHDVMVIGAGLGGLAAALALQQRGFRVRVYEKSPQLGEVGAGITAHPNLTRALERLGLGEGLSRVGTQHVSQGVCDLHTLRVMVRNERGAADRERFGAFQYQLHRADLHRLLLEAVVAADPQAIATGKALVSVVQTADGVSARFADGSDARGSVLVGADGVRSRVRQQLFGDESPVFTGHVAYRTLVPADACGGLGDLPFTSGLAITPGRNLGWYSVRDGTLINVVGLVQSGEWADEGWSFQSDVATVTRLFADAHPEFLRILRGAPPGSIFRWGLFTHAPLARWSSGRVTLLGDAAHAMLPFMGMGAAMAVEDGYVLARCLAAFPDVRVALQAYELARVERANFVQAESAAKAARLEGRDAPTYDKSKHRNEESLGLFTYDVETEPLPVPAGVPSASRR